MSNRLIVQTYDSGANTSRTRESDGFAAWLQRFLTDAPEGLLRPDLTRVEIYALRENGEPYPVPAWTWSRPGDDCPIPHRTAGTPCAEDHPHI